jgi:hypothetical protein
LREDESNSGLDELIQSAQGKYKIPEEKLESMIEPSFEKAGELARLIV